MIRMTVAEIAAAVGGRTFGSATLEVTGTVHTDSREVRPGDLFVAMPGAQTDGHRFVDAAVAAGAALIIAERPVEVPIPVIVVDRGLQALSDLARAVVARVRSRGSLKVVAVTGSNGKTTTKNMLREILQVQGPTVAPRGSFNNEVGAPITMLAIDEETRFLVVEMGADAVGDIAKLVAVAAPDIAIALTVGLAHIGKFGDIEQTALAKSEIVESLPESAIAVLNRDDPRVAAMATKTEAPVRWFGIGNGTVPGQRESAAMIARNVQLSLAGTQFDMHHADRVWPVQLRILGEHHVSNALAALTAAGELGVPLPSAIAALEGMGRAERWRMEVLPGPAGSVVINDAYNASPDSMAAALRTLASLTRGRNRAIAVVGEMAELGDSAGAEHDRIGELAVRLNLDLLVVVGPAARRVHLSATREGSWDGESVYAPDPDAAYDVLCGELRSDDVVLVKSSNSAGLRQLGDRLTGVTP